MKRRMAVAAAVLVLMLAANAAAQLVAPPELRRADPPSPEMTAMQLEGRADELRSMKFYADAIDYYEAALKRGGKPSPLHNKIGIAELQMMRFDAARKSFDRALRFDKNSPEAWNNLGVAWYSKKKYGSAIKAYERALKLNIESASFHSNLGTAYFQKRDYDRANLEYQRALELDPDVFEHRGGNGVALQMLSPAERAKFSYTVARTYAKQGNTERALLYLRKAMEDGFPQIDNVFKDDEFASLRKDPRFAELMAQKMVVIPQD